VRAWRKIDPGVVQISYALGNDHAYAWSRSEAGVVVSALSQTPKDLEQELTELGALDRQAASQAFRSPDSAHPARRTAGSWRRTPSR
jgi:hypothetical protein